MEHREGRAELAPDLNELTHSNQCLRFNSCNKKVTKRVRICENGNDDHHIASLQSQYYGMSSQERKFLNLSDSYHLWCRIDKNAKALRTTTKDGPDWKSVIERITVNGDTGDIINQVKISHDNCRDIDYHRSLVKPVSRTKTILVYKPLEKKN